MTHVNITPLKWKFIHHESNQVMSVSLIKRKFVYFHLHHRKNIDKNVWYLQKKIIPEFEKRIDFYCIPEEEKENLKTAIYEKSWLKLKDNKTEKTVIKKKIAKLESDKAWLITMRRTWELSSSEFLEEKNKIINETEDYQNKLIGLNRKDDIILTNLDKMVELFINLKDIWKTADLEKKIEIISNIVVELRVDNQKRLYIVENQLFRTFRSYNRHKWWIHRGLNPGPTA